MKQLTMMQHFAELRRRILWVVVIFVVALGCGWFFAPWMQEFLTAPLLHAWSGGTMLYTGVTDGLMIRFSLAIVFALIVVLPVGLWHIWAYVSPGLRPSEQNFIWPVLVLSPLLFVIGAAFAFYILFPFVFAFFIELNANSPVPTILLPAARDYLSFAINLLKVFGLAFQLPLILVLLNRIGVLGRTYALKMRRYIVVGIVVMAAVLTPPDIVSQLLLAVPMWLLFEISVLFMKRD